MDMAQSYILFSVSIPKYDKILLLYLTLQCNAGSMHVSSTNAVFVHFLENWQVREFIFI